MFSDKDLKLLESKNITQEKVIEQIEMFRKGVSPVKLYQVATEGNGVLKLDDIEEYIEVYDKASLKVVKFVPASGAASRMFKDLFAFKEDFAKNPDLSLTDYPEMEKFFSDIKKFAFYNALDEALSVEGGIERLKNGRKYDVILSRLLGEEGLAYGDLPKGLLAFHFYAGGVARTPFEEHLIEGAKYAQSTKGIVHIHFTVSPEHLQAFEALKEKAVKKYQEMYNVKYKIEFSIQKASTDTLAVNEDNNPFYNSDNEMLFRPGGHGALIENLNEIDSDLIFIKNIDNIVPEKRLSNTIKYKKALAGYLYQEQQKVFRLIRSLNNAPNDELIEEALDLLKITFNIESDLLNCEDKDELVKNIIAFLDRPMRVCGVVKNLGEPGGGPFITINENEAKSPQIVESSQVDMSNKQQSEMFSKSTHFNPVDLICAVKNHKGEKFDLKKYVDPDTCFISEKSKDGKVLKALELPGLWNGAMADWNTSLVEVTADTFNPVKTVNDLLRVSHQ